MTIHNEANLKGKEKEKELNGIGLGKCSQNKQ